MNRIFFVIIIAAVALAGVPVLADSLITDNIIIVLDASGSMNNDMKGSGVKKMDAAKDALKATLNNLPENAQVGLLVFSAQNLDDDWVYPLSPPDMDQLLEAVYKPFPGGKTPLGAYIKKGADRLLEERERQYGYGTFRLLVVTDGEAGDPRKLERFVPEAIARGITIDVIGVDMAGTHTLATKVHSYRSANDPESLARAVAQVFAEIGDTTTGDTGEDAFDELADLPEELASAMLTALSTTQNMPLGQNPDFKAQSEPAPKAPATATKKSGGKKSGRLFGLPISLVVVIVIIIFVKTLRSSRKRR